MHTIERFDRLKQDVNVFYHRNLSYSELERDAYIIELRVENCKTRLQFLSKHLCLLYSTVPLLIATKATSMGAWQSRMEIPQEYTSHDGHKKPLLISQSDMEKIIKDQLQGIEEFFDTLRQLKSDCLTQERTLQETTQKEILNAIKTMEETMKQMHGKIERLEAVQNAPRPEMASVAIEARINEERAIIANNAEFMETAEADEDMEDEDAALDREIEALEADLAEVSRHRRELARKRTCRPREYRAGVYRREERQMRCVFCGVNGRHYSDSCGRIRTGVERREYLTKAGRCKNCLEIDCERGESCTKSRIPCFHCKQRGHHSAVCTLPETSLQIEAEKRHCELEMDDLHERLRKLRILREARN
ncbi:hypothetical protein OSTOST_19466 [Ostertagia ostertagi]